MSPYPGLFDLYQAALENGCRKEHVAGNELGHRQIGRSVRGLDELEESLGRKEGTQH